MVMGGVSILLLGGYGAVGKVLARLILQETQVDLIIAGRRLARAQDFVHQLQQEFPPHRVTARYADAADRDSLLTAFQQVHLVIVLTTTPHLIAQIGQAALTAGCDYVDILVSSSTYTDLLPLTTALHEQNRIFITQGGFHPGLPAALVRYGAQFFDRYDRAIIAMAMNARFEQPGQAAEIIPMVTNFSADICQKGAWRKSTFRDAITMDMGPRFGKTQLFPMQMEEIKQVQKMYHLQDTGVYVSGFNWLVDYLVFPLIWLTQKIKSGLAVGLMQRLFTWGVNTFSSSRQGVVMLNDAAGLKDERKKQMRIMVEHDDAYLFTAIPVVACLKQYLAGTLPRGLAMMGQILEVNKLFTAMAQMGIKISVEEREENEK